MRSMLLVKAGPSEHTGPPPPEAIAQMNVFNQEMIAAGVMLDGNGLFPSSEGLRIINKGGNIEIIDGPFTEAKELIGGYWIIQTETLAEAIDWVKRAPFQPGGQVEIRPLFDLDDFPAGDDEIAGWREEEAEMREQWESAKSGGKQEPVAERKSLLYMSMGLANERTEAGVMPTEQELAMMGEFIGKAAAANTILSGEGLKPSSEGARVYFEADGIRVVDGPFTETKELIAGYALVQYDSVEDARAWSRLAALASGDGETQLRRVMRPEDYSR